MYGRETDLWKKIFANNLAAQSLCRTRINKKKKKNNKNLKAYVYRFLVSSETD
jgi:hypothetical protein